MSTKSIKKSSAKKTVEEVFRDSFGSSYHCHINCLDFLDKRQSGICDHLVVAHSAEEIIRAANIAREYLLPFEIVGKTGLSLISNFGYDGLLIVNRSKMINFDPSSSAVLVESGTVLTDLINQAASRSLGSLEIFSAIASTVGGAIVTNLTVGKISFWDYLREITVLRWESNKAQVMTLKPEEFSYQDYWSGFMDIREPFAILSAKIQLAQLPQDVILKRISRHRLEEKKKSPAIAYPFSPPLDLDNLTALNPREINDRNYWLDQSNHNLIMSRKSQINQQDLKLFLDKIKTKLASEGIMVRSRVKLIGSWMEDEADIATDTESF